MTGMTVVSVAVPAVRVRVLAPELALVLDTVTTVVTIGVVALGWIRYRQRRDAVALFQAAAFLALVVVNAVDVLVSVAGLAGAAGMSLSAPGQAPLYDFTAAHLYAGALLVIGGWAALHGRNPRRPRAVVLLVGAATVATIALVHALDGILPSLGSMVPAAAGAPSTPTGLPVPTLLGATLQVAGAALFLWAAALSRRLFRRDHSIGDAYLAVGLVFAAFAEFETAFYPGTYSGLVTSADVLRLAFDVSLLLGIEAEASGMLRDLRRANEELALLREAEVDRAALAERARVSRELHDGLAQNLWLAKLKTGRLRALPELDPEVRALADELGEAVDAGLAEAQEAIAALRLDASAGEGLCRLMRRLVDDFADRFGLRTEFECEPDLPALPARTQAEALRVAHEALSNVRRHADATRVRVRVGIEAGRLVVCVRDNGQGFDPASVEDRAFGLTSMRERATLLGGELEIDSRPQGGTLVRLLVPLSQPAGTVRAAG